MQTLRQDAQAIIDKALADALPDSAVRRALEQFQKPEGRLVLIAAGKAAWQMAKAAYDVLGTAITSGAVITKYDHVKGPIGALELFEAGHPVPDENSYRATSRALELVSGLSERDTVLFLLSGGGSALFESPLVPAEEMADVTKQLLACGADIVEMNTLRKRLSAVKGGRFAERCLPAKVFSIVLSDILGDPLDMIASGPAYPDSSTCAQALEVVRKYGLRLSESALELLAQETPKTLTNVETHITGSVRQLCASAEQTARALGYTPVILTASLRCTARDAGSFLASIAQCHQDSKTSLAYIAGGETVVHLTGHGLGGRNQEIALSAAQEIAGLRDTAVFSFGSDGTDGPTDAAGGYCDGDTCAALAANTLVECGGGMCAVADGKVLAVVPLPIAGLMNDLPVREMAELVAKLDAAWKQMGCVINSPYMTMALVPLACLPELRLTNRGLVDCRTFRFVPLFAEE